MNDQSVSGLILSNKQTCQMISFIDLSEKEQEDFNYMLQPNYTNEQDTPRFARYQAGVYDTSDMAVIDPGY